MQEQEIGKVTHYFGKVGVGIIELTGTLKVGDQIHFKGSHDDFTQTVESIQIEHQDVPEAKAGDVIGTRVQQKVHPHDIVFKVVP